MKSEQIKMYRAEWAKCQKRLREAGRDASDEVRYTVHQLVTGFRCSSKDLDNAALDAVLLWFRTKLHAAGEWQAFLAHQRSPLICCRHAARRLCRLALATITTDKGADAYIEGICRQMFRKDTQMATVEDWEKICAALKFQGYRETAKKKAKATGKTAPVAPEMPAVEEFVPAGFDPDNPFG